MTYGPSIADGWRPAAAYVDKIPRSAKPGELPVEQPTRFELVINLKTAQAIGSAHRGTTRSRGPRLAKLALAAEREHSTALQYLR